MNAKLRAMYLDYLNNWLTVDCFAEYHEMSAADMSELLKIGRKLHEEYASQYKQELMAYLINS